VRKTLRPGVSLTPKPPEAEFCTGDFALKIGGVLRI
jgi:hypothetical protein